MKKLIPFWQLALAATAVLQPLVVKSAPADLTLQAQLVWGTNNDKPDDPKLKDVDPKVTDKLRGVFKWKNYYEVNRQNFTVTSSAPKKVKMSGQCEIEVQNMGGHSGEWECYGQG